MDKFSLGVALVAVVLAGFALFGSNDMAAGAVSQDCANGVTCLGGSFRIKPADGATVANLIVDTANTATSTTKLGCIQTVATSTATPLRLVIGSTQAASTTFQGSNSNFTVLAQFGECPA